ncbi:MAG TPA: PIN domain-containing protein [Longimicrobium sp.]|nr:PIN domain-containing protein [Longimicrobium sp.]
MAPEVFLDTSFAVALTVASDRHHTQALALADEAVPARAKLVTTAAVVLEIGNSLARARYRGSAVDVLTSLRIDPRVEIVPLTDDLLTDAFERYRARRDKEWGLTDCVSFLVMERRGLVDVLSADDHFRQAGFRPLMLPH